jgi:hypothetical protein
MSVITATQEVVIRAIVVGGHTGQKVNEIPISNNKPCLVVHTCGPSYGEAWVEEWQSKASPGQKLETLSKKITDAKRD